MTGYNRLLASVTALAFAGSVYAAETGSWDQPTEPLASRTEVTVYRSPSCGCCGKWIEHMKRHGFIIKDVKENDMDALKRKLGVPASLQSCHTGVVNGYLIEGHVPAADVKRLLNTKPDLAGIAVPGMPIGPPGMDMGSRKDPFSVIGFGNDGQSSVFSDYRTY